MKSIKEASIEWIENESISKNTYETERAFRAGIEFSQRWISVDEELPEEIKELIGNKIKSENVIVKRQWDDNGEIAIEINCRFKPSEKIGFVWNIQYPSSKITHWRPISIS